MMRLVLGVVCGLLVAFALVFATDALFHMLVPSAVRPTDPAAMPRVEPASAMPYGRDMSETRPDDAGRDRFADS